MPKRKPNLNTIYISERVQECLRPIARSALTTVVAPMGYGKTTAINWFLAEKTKGGKAVAIRMSIYSGSLPLLWSSAQRAFRFAGLDVLDTFDFPGDEASAGLIMDELCRVFSGDTSYYLFLDDFHLLRDDRAVRFLCRISMRLTPNAHLIVASRDRFLPAGEIVRLGGNLHQIGMEQLRLNHTELAVYAHKCGAELSEQQLDSLLRSSEGWFSAIYLNLRAYAERGRLPDGNSDIFEMFTAAMIDPLTPSRQEFLAVMGLADEFTAEMARFVTGNAETSQIILDLTCQNAFVTRLPDSQNYRFHHMMKECARRKFLTLPAQKQTAYWNRFGDWYGTKKQYLHALGAYGTSGNNDAALTIIEKDAGNLLSALHPEELLERLSACPAEVLMRHPTAILVLMRRLFTWRQIPKMLELKTLLERAIAGNPAITDQERGNLLGECDLIMSFLLYNDIAKMSALHRSASRQMTRPAVTIQSGSSWTFGSPSVLMMYYRAPGELQKELYEMNECMPHYYRITNGHGLGAELVMAAEALWMQGKLRETEVGLARARAKIAGSGQENMALCCDFLELRLHLVASGCAQFDFAARKDALLARHDVVLLNMFESILAYYYALLGQTDKIPSVFRLHRLDTINYFAPGKPMMDLIENQVYLAQGEYARVIGRSEALVSVCEKLHYALVSLHLRIQTAAAYEKLGNRLEARKLLDAALLDAEPDFFAAPFAENAPYLIEHYTALLRERETPLLKQICALCARWLAGCNAMTQAHLPQLPGDLSERELSVAGLIAARKTNREIAETLYLSEGTVKQYINRIYSKLHLTGTAQEKRRALSALLQKNEAKN